MSTCPRCRADLAAAAYEDVSVETCQQCGGYWLTQPALKQIIDTREQEWNAKDLEAIKNAPRMPVALDEIRERLPCPVCGEAMEPFNFSGDSGILLDRCGRCGGIWLDRGELEKVQMVVEASDEKLDEDRRRFSGWLHEIEVQEDVREQQDLRASRARAFAAVANQVLNP